jgi:phage N-6-adenine-methyltransferase
MTESRGYMLPSKTVEWGTPQALFDDLHAEFDFTLDVAASHENAKCERYFTREEDGLKQDWAGERCFMNPPYGYGLKHWTKKAFDETHNPFARAELVVGLLPVRSCTAWFHDHVYGKAEIRFLRGRLKFEGGKGAATFPSMIVVWRGVGP